MDKEKQIREIAKIIMEAIQGETHLVKPANIFEAAVEAEALYNAGYRKIPEDSVVLTREEYENMQFVAELIGTKQKIGACDFNRVVLQRTKQARKETAREILNYLWKQRNIIGQLMIFEKNLIELAKQYNVKIGEEV